MDPLFVMGTAEQHCYALAYKLGFGDITILPLLIRWLKSS
jgi:hypothetical protein